MSNEKQTSHEPVIDINSVEVHIPSIHCSLGHYKLRHQRMFTHLGGSGSWQMHLEEFGDGIAHVLSDLRMPWFVGELALASHGG